MARKCEVETASFRSEQRAICGRSTENDNDNLGLAALKFLEGVAPDRRRYGIPSQSFHQVFEILPVRFENEDVWASICAVGSISWSILTINLNARGLYRGFVAGRSSMDSSRS